MNELPAGAVPLPQRAVTAEITAWADEVLADAASYPMGAVAGPRPFGALELVAHVEVHTWYGADPGRPASRHRGVSIYEVRS